MNKQLSEKLDAIYPAMLGLKKTVESGEPFYPIVFGYDCGDGWYNILKVLFQQFRWVEFTYGVRTVLTQVKEKFGGLRVYYYTEIVPDHLVAEADGTFTRVLNQGRRLTDAQKNFDVKGVGREIAGAVQLAEAYSFVTCEECGCPGKTENPGWIVTRCDQHFDAYMKARGSSVEEYRLYRKKVESGELFGYDWTKATK